MVVCVGVTEVEPDWRSPLPGPGLMLTLVAFCTTHVRVEAWPVATLAGLAVNWMMFTCPGVTVVTSVVAWPFSPSVLVTVRRKA